MVWLSLLVCSGCAPSLSSETRNVVERMGHVPDCARSSLRWITQEIKNDRVFVSASYSLSTACASKWDGELESHGFIPQSPHGELVKSWNPLVMVTPASERGRAIIFEQATPLSGVKILAKENH